MKRILVVILLVIAVSSAFFISFFNINHYSGWLSAEIEKHSGYQVRFNLIDIEDWSNPQLTISGIDIAHQGKAIITIRKLHISSREFDIWDRYLDIALVDLHGVTILVDEETLQQIVKPNNVSEKKENTPPITELLPWKHLLIDNVSISDVSSEIDYQNNQLNLQELDLNFSDLLIISDNQFAYQWQEGSYQLTIKAGQLLLEDHQSLDFSELMLQSDFNLMNLQADLLFTMKNITIDRVNLSSVVIDNTILQLQLDNNKLTVQRLVSDVFSGQLQLQGEVLFTLRPLSKDKILVDKAVVSSLLIKDMQLFIPTFAKTTESETIANQKINFPINQLRIEQAHLQNINISSSEQSIPLLLKEGNAYIRDLQVLENNSFVNFFVQDKQMGTINLSFTYLQWNDLIIEAFQGELGDLPILSP